MRQRAAGWARFEPFGFTGGVFEAEREETQSRFPLYSRLETLKNGRRGA